MPARFPRFNALRAMQHRNFQLFIAGQLVSLSGTWMQSTAQLWLVYKLTGSAALLVSSDLPIRCRCCFCRRWAATSGTTTTAAGRHVDANRFDDSGICAGGLTLSGAIHDARGAWVVIFIAFLVAL